MIHVSCSVAAHDSDRQTDDIYSKQQCPLYMKIMNSANITASTYGGNRLLSSIQLKTTCSIYYMLFLTQG